MASVVAANAIDRGFDPRSGQTKDYTIDFGIQYKVDNLQFSSFIGIFSDDMNEL
jgi:hypothetical protein